MTDNIKTNTMLKVDIFRKDNATTARALQQLTDTDTYLQYYNLSTE